MSKMPERFEPLSGNGTCHMERVPDGRWVTYVAFAALLDELDRAGEALKQLQQQEQDLDKTEKYQQREPGPKGEDSAYSVRHCRGHWHVQAGEFDLAIPGDPFRDEASALAAAERLAADDAAREVRAMSETAAASFYAFEARVAPDCFCQSCNAMRSYSYTMGCCPRGLSHGPMCTCGGIARPATMLPERALAIAVDPSRSPPKKTEAVDDRLPE